MAGINRTTDKATDLITFSRASVGTALRKISYGSELVTNGDFSGGSTGWSASASWTIGSGVATSSGGTGQIIQAGKLTIGKVYLITYDATISGGYATIFGTSIQIKTGSGLTASFKCSDTSLGFYGFGFTGTIDNISVKEVLFDQPDGTLTLFNHPNDVPRIEYDAAGNVKGLLIEEARTNNVTYSEAFDNAVWQKNYATISADAAVSPSGLLNADAITPDTNSNIHSVSRSVTLAAGTATLSFFAKANGYNWVRCNFLGSTGEVFFDLQNGVVGTAGSTANIQDFGDGWYRCSMSSANILDPIIAINVASADGVVNFVGDGTSGIYIYGAQLEAGSFPTSYIPTSGATATRAADIASISVDSFGYRQDAGTVVVECETSNDANITASRRPYTLTGVSSQIGATFIYDNGVFDIADSGSAVGKHGTAIKSGSMAIVNNSGTPRASTASLDGDYSSGEIIIGGYLSATNLLNGHIKSIAYYPRRLSNAQLQELTA